MSVGKRAAKAPTEQVDRPMVQPTRLTSAAIAIKKNNTVIVGNISDIGFRQFGHVEWVTDH